MPRFILLILLGIALIGCVGPEICGNGIDDDRDGFTDEPACELGEPSDSGNDRQCKPESECCAVCSVGRACGDACISESDGCEQMSGCACDDWEVCR